MMEIRSCINPDRVSCYREMYELERFRCKVGYVNDKFCREVCSINTVVISRGKL